MVRQFLLPAALLSVAFGCAGTGERSAPEPPARAETASGWVDSTLASLSLRAKVGQMIMPWLLGDYLAADSDAFDRLRGWVEEDGIGGLVISVGPPLEVASKLNMLQEMAAVPLLVTADVEHGAGQRLDGGVLLPYGWRVGGGTSFPPLMAIGAADDERLAYELGRVTALEARAAGIHVALAPVADVNNNPANPIINTRSYGADPASVGRLVAAHVRGLQDHGMLATAKHFPGHGDTDIDSHIEMPVITADERRVDSVELVPFRAAIDAGVEAIMSAHIAFPALTGDSVPATLSPALLEGLLRERLGFDGLVFTDALNMGGIVRGYGAGRAAVLAIRAGADILLMPPDIGSAIDSIIAAVERGEVAETRIDQSVRKLLAAKRRVGLGRARTVELDRVPYEVGGRGNAELAREAAERGITLTRDRDGLLPIDPLSARRVLHIVYTAAYDPLAGAVLRGELAARFGAVELARLHAGARADGLDSLGARADSADLVIFSPFVGVPPDPDSVAIDPAVAAFIDSVAVRRPTVVTAFGSPYVLDQFPRVGTYLIGWGRGEVSERAVGRALAGAVPVTGRLPVPLPPHHRLGAGIRRDTAAFAYLPRAAPGEIGMAADSLRRLDELIEGAIEAGITPGAALAVGRRGRLVRLRGYGRVDWDTASPAVTDSTIYDIASLTKVIGTTTAAMLLADDGRLDLDAPLAEYLPEWDGSPAKRRVTARDLLRHTSGLPAFRAFWRDARGRAEFLERIAALELEAPPGERTIYSDLGFILLGLALERLADSPLDAFLTERVVRRLGLRETGYSPLQTGWRPAWGGGMSEPALLEHIAPTERDTTFRGMHVHGIVHDENAFAVGGVAGHAGLFSSARDLAVLAQMLLDGGELRGTRLIEANTVREFTRRQAPGSTRALGWDSPGERSSAGDLFPAAAFGHTGFTGTSVWIDPEGELFVVLLTNRINPTRSNGGITGLRRAVHDAVQRAVREAENGRGASETS